MDLCVCLYHFMPLALPLALTSCRHDSLSPNRQPRFNEWSEDNDKHCPLSLSMQVYTEATQFLLLQVDHVDLRGVCNFLAVTVSPSPQAQVPLKSETFFYIKNAVTVASVPAAFPCGRPSMQRPRLHPATLWCIFSNGRCQTLWWQRLEPRAWRLCSSLASCHPATDQRILQAWKRFTVTKQKPSNITVSIVTPEHTVRISVRL